MKLKKIFAIALTPIHGQLGFRKLDYEFAKRKLKGNQIMNKLEDCHFNLFGLVIRDTDGACVWDTEIEWNPTSRDILGEFCDSSKDRNIRIMVAFINMNDVYQDYLHPEKLSIHGKKGKKLGKKYKKGDLLTHKVYEIRIDVPKRFQLRIIRKYPFFG